MWNLAPRFTLENSFVHSTFFRSCIVDGSQLYFLKNNHTKNVFYTKVVLYLFISEKSLNTFTKDTIEIVYHVIRVGVLFFIFSRHHILHILSEKGLHRNNQFWLNKPITFVEFGHSFQDFWSDQIRSRDRVGISFSFLNEVGWEPSTVNRTGSEHFLSVSWSIWDFHCSWKPFIALPCLQLVSKLFMD